MTGSYHIKITVFMWSKLRPQYISYHNSYPTLRHSNRYPFDLWHVPLAVFWISGISMHFQVEGFSYSVPFPFHPCLQKIPSLSGASMSDKALASPHGDHTHNWQKTIARNNQKYVGFIWFHTPSCPLETFLLNRVAMEYLGVRWMPHIPPRRGYAWCRRRQERSMLCSKPSLITIEYYM